MINKNEINNNITALCEVFLENKQDELETVDELIISLIKKDNSTEHFTIPKNKLVSKMITIFENGKQKYSHQISCSDRWTLYGSFRSGAFNPGQSWHRSAFVPGICAESGVPPYFGGDVHIHSEYALYACADSASEV